MSTPIPVVNVNLRAGCGCFVPENRDPSTGHYPGCPCSPVIIPCPIPRSVTLTVRLGECACPYGDGIGTVHDGWCPGRPITVTCSISGKTWPESEVDDGEPDIAGLAGRIDNEKRKTIMAACRALWALVKVLVLGHTDLSALLTGPKALELLAQRDAVFAALADMARHEGALADALGDFETALRGEPTAIGGMRRFSHDALARYVERLIEQVRNIL